jgi:signal transduction histidine kinase
MIERLRQPSLLWKIVLSTSIAITALLAAAGWLVQEQTRSTLSRNLETQLRSSSRAYESLWQARTDMLRSVSLVLSSMSDVRRAFQTNDQATIQDSAQEIWSRISQSTAIFVVTDPRGEVIASLGGAPAPGRHMEAVRDAAHYFPKQAAGYAMEGNRLFQFVVTPVYVETQHGPGLLNVLVAGFPVDEEAARDLRERTGGNDFLFIASGKPLATTLSTAESLRIAREFRRGSELQNIDLAEGKVAVLGSTLRDFAGNPVGDLLIVHNFDIVQRDLEALETKLFFIWAAAVIGGLLVSVFLAGRVLKPIGELDAAAARIARQQYDTRVRESSSDELGRLAHTFNTMCASLEKAREDLIRQERITTIGRLSSSIVHDLRNPLAAIYGGAEMMVDGHLSNEQLQRLAGNIYQSSRAIKDLLQELVDVSRGRIHPPEICRLNEVVGAAVEAEAATAAEHGVEIHQDVNADIELPAERARMERVFVNLINNAIEAMPNGGRVEIAARQNGAEVLVSINDSGPGIPEEVRQRLFQPFATARKNGIGLGLALSRQTVLDHGGDLWAETAGGAGAHFRLRLPAEPCATIGTSAPDSPPSAVAVEADASRNH